MPLLNEQLTQYMLTIVQVILQPSLDAYTEHLEYASQPGASCLFTVSCGRCLVNVCKAGVRLRFWSEGKTKLLLNRVLNRHKYFSFLKRLNVKEGGGAR